MTRARFAAAAVVLVLAGGGALEARAHHRRMAAAVASNVLPADYTGPEECRTCHEENYKRWRAHPHSRMNAVPGPTTVKGDFANARVQVPGGEAVFTTENGVYFMTLERAHTLVRRYRVTRTVGSRFMQFYIGVLVAGPEPATSSLYRDEMKLPYGYWFKLARWLPETYFDPGPEEFDAEGNAAFEPFLAPRVQPYRQSCIFCHNTYAYVFRLGCAEHAGYPAADLAVDQRALLPELLRDGVLRRRTRDGATSVFVQLDPDKLVTLGISCESCHFGGRAHASGEVADPRFAPATTLATITPHEPGADPEPSRKNPYSVNAICAQCHCAVVPLFPNGAGTWNSREALDLEAGACRSAIKCTDCHEPHTASPPESSPEGPANVASCLRCHPRLAEPAAAAKHAGHLVTTGVTCLDCHMPRISQGLEEVVRSHRISSPADPSMLSTSTPNACNLCHLDRSLRWTIAALEKGWGRKIAAPAGDLDALLGPAWLASTDHFVRLVSTQAYARSPLGRAALPGLLTALEDPVPVNRVFATFAVERVLGTKLGASYDVAGTPAERHGAVEALRVSLK